MDWHALHSRLKRVGAHGLANDQFDRCAIYLGHRNDLLVLHPPHASNCADFHAGLDCTPYLLKLGLTKSRTSLVWIAGPLSGLIMQPVVGVMADRSNSKWGRRRPFMIGGALIVAACLLVLGWTAEIVGLFVTSPDSKKTGTIILAVLSIYAVDFAINAVQASCRSLIVDTLPVRKQQMGSAWASRMVAVGHLLSYGTGTMNLVRMFGTTLGGEQFKQVCVISAAVLLTAVGITSYSVQERVLIARRDADAGGGAWKVISQILSTTWNMPKRMKAICWIQFWSWIGWFPFLFYSSTWVGETYFRYESPPQTGSKDTLGDIGRVGSFSLVIFSFISLAGSVALPWLIRAPEEERRPSWTPRPPPSMSGFALAVERYRPDLLTAWTWGHLMFSGAMFLAPLVHSLRFATTIVALCGLPWALSSWAPFTFLGIEINKVGNTTTGSISNDISYRRLSDDVSEQFEMDSHDAEANTLHLHHPSTSSSDHDMPSSSTGELAGVYLGILNLFTTLPQFVGTFISTIVFAILEPGKSPELAKEAHPDEHHSIDGPNAIAVCMFIGALSTVGAAYATTRLRYVQ
ncbi:MAG: hypothetical protein M1823_001372 [Watsoniomyces obsoletus]|nr:MAG: hypothetical protein M1823_001372 [Watsoniomyces obsoletus]